MPSQQHPERLAYYGGDLGALARFAQFLGGLVWLGLIGAPSERGFWPIQVDPERFTAGGLVLSGIERAVDVSVFTLLRMGLVAGNAQPTEGPSG